MIGGAAEILQTLALGLRVERLLGEVLLQVNDRLRLMRLDLERWLRLTE